MKMPAPTTAAPRFLPTARKAVTLKTASRLTAWILGTTFASLSFATPARAVDLSTLKVLYVGDAGSKRAGDFESFLKLNTAEVEVANRTGFQPAAAKDFDVVLLDWPQTGNGNDFPPKRSPLGARDPWTKPTVLLGSAGLNTAIAWMAKGGSG